jgi:hypothetical protein
MSQVASAGAAFMFGVDEYNLSKFWVKHPKVLLETFRSLSEHI